MVEVRDGSGNRVARDRIGMYDHLNKYDGIKIPLDMNELAKSLLGMNYGAHRFLSALYKEAKNDDRIDRSELVEGLEKLFFYYSV